MAIGLILGRWWLLLLVPPAVFVWQLYFENSILAEGIQSWIALVTSAASAAGILAGILLRRFVRPS